MAKKKSRSSRNKGPKSLELRVVNRLDKTYNYRKFLENIGHGQILFQPNAQLKGKVVPLGRKDVFLLGGYRDGQVFSFLNKDVEPALLDGAVVRDLNAHVLVADGIELPLYSFDGQLENGEYIVNAFLVPVNQERTIKAGYVAFATGVQPVGRDYNMQRVRRFIKTRWRLLYDFGEEEMPLLSQQDAFAIWSTFAFLEGEIGVNLIMVAPPRAGKSLILELFSRATGDQIVAGEQVRLKGLVPSFARYPPSPGALLSARVVSLIDEFARAIQAERRDARAKYLEVLLSMLNRVARQIPSGKGSIQGRFNAAFIATTNEEPWQAVRDYLVSEDPAALDRFSVINIGYVKNSIRHILPSAELYLKKFGLEAIEDMRNYINYILANKAKVRVDPNELLARIDESSLPAGPAKGAKYQLIERAVPIARCIYLTYKAMGKGVKMAEVYDYAIRIAADVYSNIFMG